MLRATSFTPKSLQRIVLLIFLAFFILLMMTSSASVAVTLDEPLHYHYGMFVLQGNTDRIDDSSMPVSALNALPNFVSTYLPDGTLKIVLGCYFLARLITMLFSAGVAALVFQWTSALYGLGAAALSGILYILDPNILAHSQLVTTDIIAAGMIAICFYLLWKFANNRKTAYGVLCALAIGLSQLVKYTAVALFPLCLLVLLLHDWPFIRSSYGQGGKRAVARYFAGGDQQIVSEHYGLQVGWLPLQAGFVTPSACFP